ncbi:MAG: nucleotidyltransferase domain-containing protein [Proteobacteria bacterium]|nr:nucleotidyltransferase domain-containing protein [Pseudomonadota bacterium]
MHRKLVSNEVSPEDVAILVTQCREIILNRIEPTAIYLFGSAALGGFTTASDLDIAVVLESEEAIKIARKKLCGLAAALDCTVDILYYTPSSLAKGQQHGGICEVIISEGRKIYDSKTAI